MLGAMKLLMQQTHIQKKKAPKEAKIVEAAIVAPPLFPQMALIGSA